MDRTVPATQPYQTVIEHLDEEALIETVRGALRIPSLSGEEEEVARYFVDVMTTGGLEAELQPVPASPMMGPSYNALGRLRGTRGGAALLFNGHIDHNPVSNGWTKDPFGAEIADGWIYGFVHMKAANACYIAAVDAVRRSGIELTSDVAIAHVCGELRGGAGTRHALRQGLMADCFVLGEPTELQLATAHSASRVVKVHVLGRMKHFATEDVAGFHGVNAVEQAARIICALGGSHRPLKPRGEGGFLTFEPQPGFEGLPQLNVGPIRGGISRRYDETRPALFPDVCTLTLDFRIIPGMSKESLERDLREFLDRFREEEPGLAFEIEFADETFPLPFDSPPNAPVVQSVAAAHRHVLGHPPAWSRVLRFAASDASWMQAAGIPGVIYGPTGRYLSRPDERCEVKDLVHAAQVYACVIADLCSAEGTHPLGELT